MSSEECRRQILEKYQELADALEKENRQLKDELRGVKKESGDSEVRQSNVYASHRTLSHRQLSSA